MDSAQESERGRPEGGVSPEQVSPLKLAQNMVQEVGVCPQPQSTLDNGYMWLLCKTYSESKRLLDH